MFENLVKPNRLTTIDGDFRQPFDPTNYPMFRRYESGYALFLVLDIPNMLTELTKHEKGPNTGIEYRKLYADLICSYIRTLEREFKRLDGIENITSESIEFSGLNEVTVNSINSVQEQHNATISLTYVEPYGGVLTKVNELFLKGIDDPIIGHRKHYNGLIDDKLLAPSFKNEVFSFLYLITDNTGLQLERAYYIFNAQPTTSHTGDLYNYARGEHENKELTLEYRCNILANKIVFKHAKTILGAITGYQYVESLDKFIQITKPLFEQDSNKFAYQGLTNPDKRIGGMNYSGNEIEKISALKKIFDEDYGKVTNVTTVNTSIRTIGIRDYRLEDGDPTAIYDTSQYYKIDDPLAEYEDIIYIKPNAELASCFGHKSTPRITTFTGKYSPVCKLKGYLSKELAQLWANENKYRIVYGAGAKLFAYHISLGGTSYHIKAESFYILDGDVWRDPITGLEMNIDTNNPKINQPLYKVGDKVTMRNSAGIPAFEKFIGSLCIASIYDPESKLVFTIKEVASEAVAKEIMEKYSTNFPYAHPEFHPYVIEVEGNSGEMVDGHFNEEDLKLCEDQGGVNPGDNEEDKKAKEEEERKKLIRKIAYECIRGDWDAGVKRKEKLEKAGYNFNEVQAEVNMILYGTTLGR